MKQFIKDKKANDFYLLNDIPELILNEENIILEAIPREDKVRKVVFRLNGDSACGKDGLSSAFINLAGAS